jgi:DNA-binding CsgD family transcriptional regulator
LPASEAIKMSPGLMQASNSAMGLDGGAVGQVFEASQIPMALVNSERCYVKVNDAALALFRYAREDIIGTKAGHTARDADPLIGHAQWAELLRTNEVYGVRVVEHSSGAPIRVGFAAHTTSHKGEWRALLVALSARLEASGIELIRKVDPEPSSAAGGTLTAREREIIRYVALGHSAPEIAEQLFLSRHTVNSHIRNAMIKTESHTRAQLVAIALTRGLIEP